MKFEVAVIHACQAGVEDEYSPTKEKREEVRGATTQKAAEETLNIRADVSIKISVSDSIVESIMASIDNAITEQTK